ncbi:TPA: ATP-binding protein, partial [Burkholderia vietnamiensis]|nr:ATP-binding protein [Burkholderia vietnamiensis]
LHKQLSEIEGSLLAEGHAMMNFSKDESVADYFARLTAYLEKADDIKKSDLANYVFHRKVILDILEKAIERGADGKYSKEELIHELIMPMRKTSNEVRLDSCNLWLIDERLAFHDFLASDKPLSSMPITGSTSTKEPDLCLLNVFDEPILVSDGNRLPLASIVIVEIKRPMRDDAAAGEEKDPVEQALGYLERIRTGKATTASGRPIPASDEIPGFCYAICDLTPSVERRCKMLGLRVTSDRQGYFGYNDNFKAYIEVISFDRLLNAARERNRAFFDKLGLPTN